MSDKNRNMNGINDQKTIDRTAQIALDQMETQAERDAFSEEIRRRLAQPGSGKPTLDEFKVMVYKDREKRRKKRNALVACLVAAFIVGFLAFDDLVPEVGADKNPKETIQTEDGIIIEDGGYGSSDDEDDIWKTEEWGYVSDAKEVLPKLLIPDYIPDRYVFQSLEVQTIVEEDVICKYSFANGNDKLDIEIIIMPSGETAFSVDEVTEKIESLKGDVYIQKHEKKATVFMDSGFTVSIWGDLKETELIDIINGLN